MKRSALLFIDLELSGMRAFDEVIDFAGLELRPNKSIAERPTVSLSGLVRGANEVHPDQQKLTGITADQVQKGSIAGIQEVVECISRPNLILVSYGLQFDLDWIYHSAQLNGVSMQKEYRGICLLESIEKKIGFRCALDSVVKTKRSLHRAEPDAWLHWEVANKMSRDDIEIKRFVAMEPESIR